MANATLTKRVSVLEKEVRALRKAVMPRARTPKLSPGLRAALRDVKAGRVHGPFDTVEKLMAHLEK